MKYRLHSANNGSRIQKVFIRDGKAGYREISYEEFTRRRQLDGEFAKKRFICLYHMLQEVSEDEYKDYYRCLNHVRYLKKVDRKHGLLSLDILGEECAVAIDPDIADTVCKNEDRVRLRKSLAMLKDTDGELGALLEMLFFGEMTERAAGKVFGLTQQGINKRKQRAIGSLKKFFENF